PTTTTSWRARTEAAIACSSTPKAGSSCRSGDDGASRPPLAVEPPILDRLRAVLSRQCLRAGQVGDRARDLEHPVVAASREPQARHGGGEQALGVGRERTEVPDLARAHRCVDASGARAEAVTLELPRDFYSRPDRFAGVARRHRLNLFGQQRRQLHVKVDAVEERARESAEVPRALGGRADAAVEGWTAAAAGIGGGDELKAGGKAADTAGARNRDAAVL